MPWWVFVGALFLHALYFTGLELLFLAVFVDAYFMHPGNELPLYTLLSTGLLVVVIFARPYLMVYDRMEREQ